MSFSFKKRNKKAEGSNLSLNRLSTTITSISLIFSLFFASCASSSSGGEDEKRYPLTGRVESIDIARKTITVAHDEIPEFMEAMTMPFVVSDESILTQLKSGDRITATLINNTSGSAVMKLEDVKLQ